MPLASVKLTTSTLNQDLSSTSTLVIIIDNASTMTVSSHLSVHPDPTDRYPKQSETTIDVFCISWKSRVSEIRSHIATRGVERIPPTTLDVSKD